MTQPVVTHSKSTIDRAGNILTDHMRGTALVAYDRLREALDVLDWYRRQHQGSLARAAMGCRSAAKSEGFDPKCVSQRLKQAASIVKKVAAPGGPRLSTIQDIAGCRIVLPTTADVDRVHQRLIKHGHITRTNDMRQGGKNGYRALHLICSYADRTVEVQLRTKLQHEWAADVEWIDKLFGCDLKHGNAPSYPAAQEYVLAASEAECCEEYGDRSTFNTARLHNAIVGMRALLASRGVK